MNNQIGWFCHHAIDEGWLTAEDCQSIANAFQEQGVELDLAVFVQTAIDNGLCTDVERLNELAELSVVEARTLGRAPDGMFDPLPISGPEQGPSQRKYLDPESIPSEFRGPKSAGPGTLGVAHSREASDGTGRKVSVQAETSGGEPPNAPNQPPPPDTACKHVGAFERKYRCPSCKAVSSSYADGGEVEMRLRCPQCQRDLYVVLPGISMHSAAVASASTSMQLAFEQQQGLTRVTCLACGMGVPAEAQVCGHCGQAHPASLAVERRFWEGQEPVDAVTRSQAIVNIREFAMQCKREASSAATKAAVLFPVAAVLGILACAGFSPDYPEATILFGGAAIFCFLFGISSTNKRREWNQEYEVSQKWLRENASR
jgi:hypothetical protein